MTDPAPSARTPQSQKPNETVRSLAQFKKVAKALGATVTELDRKPAKYSVKKFGVLYSPASGGCGSPGCGCSPGLWVSAFQGTRGLSAHFDRYTDRTWTFQDAQRHNDLIRACGAGSN